MGRRSRVAWSRRELATPALRCVADARLAFGAQWKTVTRARGRGRVLVATVVILVSVGCGSSRAPMETSRDGSSVPEWRRVVEALGQSAVSTYSFRFAGPPPEGSFFTLALHATDSSAAACQRYDLSSPSSDQDFWYIETTVNNQTSGEHVITTVPRKSGPIATANLTLLHRRNKAFVEAYDAIAGSVNIVVNPTPEAARRGDELVGHIVADFPVHPLFEEGCVGGALVDGGDAFRECTCKDPSGQRSTCVPSGEETCCRDPSGGTFRVSISFSATHCSGMCRVAAGAENYCFEYFGK